SHGHRNRVRDHGEESAGLQPDPLLALADQLLRDIPLLPRTLGLRGREPTPRRARLRVHGGEGRHLEGRVAPHQPDPVQRRSLLRRPRAPGVFEPGDDESEGPRDMGQSRRENPEPVSPEGRSRFAAGTADPIYKNNTDNKGNSYGTHENYLMDRRVPFARIVQHMMPFFVTRQIYTGAGKVGYENNAEPCEYQISQRADFLETEVGLETMNSRRIVNTRDEPHADPEKYRRLHVIVGDANMSEVSTYLKVGTMAIVLSMVEDDFIEKDLSIEGPVAAFRKVS